MAPKPPQVYYPPNPTTVLYKEFGNSVVVDVIQNIDLLIKLTMNSLSFLNKWHKYLALQI